MLWDRPNSENVMKKLAKLLLNVMKINIQIPLIRPKIRIVSFLICSMSFIKKSLPNITMKLYPTSKRTTS